MAENVVLAPLTSFTNDTTAVATTNANNTLLVTALADCLSLAGTQPNAMKSNLDMNTYQIINLPPPGSANSPLRLTDLSSFNNLGIGSNVIAFLNLQDQVVTGGANVTSLNLGTLSSGSITIDCGKCPQQYLTNNGAFTINAPTTDGNCLILITNGASAGAITFSGFTVGATGDTLTTTNTSKFTLAIWRINGVSAYNIKALQ